MYYERVATNLILEYTIANLLTHGIAKNEPNFGEFYEYPTCRAKHSLVYSSIKLRIRRLWSCSVRS